MKPILSALAVFGAICLCGGKPVHAAGFDCAKAVAAVEKAICASPQLGPLDDEVAVAYRRLQGSLARPWDELVRQSQREWLRSRGEETADLKGRELDDALLASLKDRLSALNGALITQNGVHLLSIDRAVVQKVAPQLAEYAQGQHQVTQNATALYVLDDLPGARKFNALIDRLLAQATDPGVAADGEYSVSVELDFASRSLVSAGVSSSVFGFGAAHPVEGQHQVNYLLAEGREMQAHDLFRGHAYENVILESATKAFVDAGLKPLASAREARAALLNPQNWALSGRGLTVVVPPDTLFAHADGSPDVPTLPWKTFQGQLTTLGENVFGK